jgi:hypothetical protein
MAHPRAGEQAHPFPPMRVGWRVSMEVNMAKTLSQFTISPEGENYVLHVETDDGETLDISATYEQLDLISEAIDERLDEDEETALAVAEGE